MASVKFALQLAQRHWPIIPLNGKHPMKSGWPDIASSDSAQIETWWRELPNPNIGILTGHKSGFWVLDIDGATGEDTLLKLIQQNDSLPETLSVQTGNGRHLYFKYPSQGEIRNNASTRLGHGLDIRGDGGYVVGVGSTHINGNSYKFIDSQTSIDEAPKWLLEMVVKRPPKEQAKLIPITLQDTEDRIESSYVESALKSAYKTVAQAPEGPKLTG